MAVTPADMGEHGPTCAPVGPRASWQSRGQGPNPLSSTQQLPGQGLDHFGGAGPDCVSDGPDLTKSHTVLRDVLQRRVSRSIGFGVDVRCVNACAASRSSAVSPASGLSVTLPTRARSAAPCSAFRVASGEQLCAEQLRAARDRALLAGLHQTAAERKAAAGVEAARRAGLRAWRAEVAAYTAGTGGEYAALLAPVVESVAAFTTAVGDRNARLAGWSTRARAWARRTVGTRFSRRLSMSGWGSARPGR